MTLSDGTQVQGTVLLYVEGQKLVLEVAGETRVYQAAQIRGLDFAASAAPTSASGSGLSAPPPSAYLPPPPGYSTPPGYPTSPTGIAHADFFRAQELVRLTVQRESLRESNRRWQVPAAMLGLSVASIFIGAGVFVAAWNDDSCSDSEWDCDGFNERKWRTSIVMMTLGGALVLISTPLLILRASRASRLKRVERTIQRLGGQLSLAPLLTPRGDAGLGARLRF